LNVIYFLLVLKIIIKRCGEHALRLLLARLICITLFYFSSQCLAIKNNALTLRVVTEEMPPYNYINDKGKLSGIALLILNELFKEIDINPKIEIMPWARAYRISTHEPNVLIFSMARTPIRENKFHWLLPVSPTNVWLFSLAKQEHQQIKSLKDIDQQTIGIVRNSSYVNFLLDHPNIDNSIIIKGVIYESLYKMLVHGHIELLVAPIQVINFLNKKLVVNKNTKPLASFELPVIQGGELYFALSKTTPLETVGFVKSKLAEVLKSEKIRRAMQAFDNHSH